MLAVAPQTQGAGTGKLLLRAADEYAKQNACMKIYMTVITVRKELIGWYERHGYKNTGRIVPFPADERFGIPVEKLEMIVLEKNV
jgi:ribosomal protein S18 acetylase RimI-like enzyme